MFQMFSCDKNRLSYLQRLTLNPDLLACQISDKLIFLVADVKAIDGDGKSINVYRWKEERWLIEHVKHQSDLFQEDDNEKHILNYAADAGMEYAIILKTELMKYLYKIINVKTPTYFLLVMRGLS